MSLSLRSDLRDALEPLNNIDRKIGGRILKFIKAHQNKVFAGVLIFIVLGMMGNYLGTSAQLSEIPYIWTPYNIWHTDPNSITIPLQDAEGLPNWNREGFTIRLYEGDNIVEWCSERYQSTSKDVIRDKLKEEISRYDVDSAAHLFFGQVYELVIGSAFHEGLLIKGHFDEVGNYVSTQEGRIDNIYLLTFDVVFEPPQTFLCQSKWQKDFRGSYVPLGEKIAIKTISYIGIKKAHMISTIITMTEGDIEEIKHFRTPLDSELISHLEYSVFSPEIEDILAGADYYFDLGGKPMIKEPQGINFDWDIVPMYKGAFYSKLIGVGTPSGQVEGKKDFIFYEDLSNIEEWLPYYAIYLKVKLNTRTLPSGMTPLENLLLSWQIEKKNIDDYKDKEGNWTSEWRALGKDKQGLIYFNTFKHLYFVPSKYARFCSMSEAEDVKGEVRGASSVPILGEGDLYYSSLDVTVDLGKNNELFMLFIGVEKEEGVPIEITERVADEEEGTKTVTSKKYFELQIMSLTRENFKLSDILYYTDPQYRKSLLIFVLPATDALKIQDKIYRCSNIISGEGKTFKEIVDGFIEDFPNESFDFIEENSLASGIVEYNADGIPFATTIGGVKEADPYSVCDSWVIRRIPPLHSICKGAVALGQAFVPIGWAIAKVSVLLSKPPMKMKERMIREGYNNLTEAQIDVAVYSIITVNWVFFILGGLLALMGLFVGRDIAFTGVRLMVLIGFVNLIQSLDWLTLGGFGIYGIMANISGGVANLLSMAYHWMNSLLLVGVIL